MVEEMKKVYETGKRTEGDYGFWVHMAQKIKRERNLEFDSKKLRKAWSALFSEYKAHFDYLER